MRRDREMVAAGENGMEGWCLVGWLVSDGRDLFQF